MGQTLSTPVTTKHSKSGDNGLYVYGLSEMQGWRISMEDAHAIHLKLEDGEQDVNSFFAVYDGHGGGAVARYSGEHVHKRLVSEEAYRERQWESALKKAFLGIDEDIRADPAFFRDPSGCTAVAALFTHDGRVFVANAGDSRSVISVKGEVKPLSFDHKPTNQSEEMRIRQAGGYVEYGRVNGNLALSRAIGDFDFKKNYSLSAEDQVITANPDVTEHELTDEDEFLILACDGIWDVLTSQQVVDIVRLQVSQRKELKEICEFICDLCLAPDTASGAGTGCDNMTILIVGILNARTVSQWYDWIADRVERNYGYETPKQIPEIYPPSRVNAARQRRQAYEERMERERSEGTHAPWRGTTAFGIARSMLGGGISFHPSTGVLSDDGALVISTADDSDEDESGDEEHDDDADADSDGGFYSSLRGADEDARDVMKSLKAQLDELAEQDEHEHDHDHGHDLSPTAHIHEHVDLDGDSPMSEPDEEAAQAFGAGSHKYLNANPNVKNNPAPVSESPEPLSRSRASSGASREETPPPRKLPNGDAAHLTQLYSSPGGDAVEPVVKIEGLLDRSEDPTKVLS